MTDKQLDYDPPVPNEPDQFTKVDNAHIIPRLWLRRFADDNDLLVVVRPKGECEYTRNTRRAGVRGRFYLRTRPKTGERMDDFEWSMSQLEGPSAQGISQIEANWPLDLGQKATLAQLFGLQLVRGRDYRFYHERLATDETTRFVLDGDRVERAVTEEDDDAGGLVPVATGLADDTERLLRIICSRPRSRPPSAR